jgi:hypothetical protein
MSSTKSNKSHKETYADDRIIVLLLKEAFARDLVLFYKLVQDLNRHWTLTVKTEGNSKELIVNIPNK